MQGLQLKDTAMCWTGALGPGIADDQPPTEMPPLTIHLDAPPPGHSFMLTGKDLYRLNCQSCHGPKGEGAPPEINSLLGPVQGASLEMTMQRMKAIGAAVSADFVKSLVKTGQETLHDRLVNGGKKMPPFQPADADRSEGARGVPGSAGGDSGRWSAPGDGDRALRPGR